jgi:hypothetical protein
MGIYRRCPVYAPGLLSKVRGFTTPGLLSKVRAGVYAPGLLSKS